MFRTHFKQLQQETDIMKASYDSPEPKPLHGMRLGLQEGNTPAYRRIRILIFRSVAGYGLYDQTTNKERRLNIKQIKKQGG